MGKPKRQPFKLKQHTEIGAMQAELDPYLKECFVDTGIYDVVRDVSSPKSILLGRTGSGKSAIIRYLKQTNEHVIEMQPEQLSLDYISNSDILAFFEEAGVKLNVFFRLLWRHVLAVEILKERYEIVNESAMSACINAIKDRVKKNKKKQKGLDYLEKWGERFWEETEPRIKETVSRMENEFTGNGKLEKLGMGLGASAAQRLSSEQKAEVQKWGKEVVSRVQMKELGEVINILSEDVFDDDQDRYYIVIDRLDEDWAPTQLRLKLIRALIEEVKTFRNVEPLKIVIALRLDLLEEVFERTRDPGFQEDKYRDLLTGLNWDRPHLEEVLAKRVEYMVTYKYSNPTVHFKDLFPNQVGKKKAMDYIIDRTLYRPRDAISFVNFVLERSVGKSHVTVEAVKKAEDLYSEERYRSLIFEWKSKIPCLPVYIDLLEGFHDPFKLTSIDDESIDKCITNASADDEWEKDPLRPVVESYLNDKADIKEIRAKIIRILWHTGIIGVKKGPKSQIQWSFESDVIITPLGESAIKPSVRYYIHPMLHRKLQLDNLQ